MKYGTQTWTKIGKKWCQEKEDSLDRSELCMIAKEFGIKKPPDRQVSVMKMNRSCNKVAHELCQFNRRVLSGGVLLSAVPTCASRPAWEDCNTNLVD
jgi:hypothetical protein